MPGMSDVTSELEKLRADLAALRAELDRSSAVVSASGALITGLKLGVAILKRDKYVGSAERTARLIDQLETTASEDAARAKQAEERATKVRSFERRKPVKKPFPEHLPRERVVVEAPAACTCCGSDRIVKVGEDVTETLEVVPRQWKVVQTVREKLSQSPAPFHPIPRGWTVSSPLAFAIGLEYMAAQWLTVFEKYGQHQPLNRQAERYAREGVEFSLSTLADQFGAATELLKPLIGAHVFAAARLHRDDTTVPLLARGGTKTARLWTYVRDDRPFDGTVPSAVIFKFSRDQSGDQPKAHPQRQER